MAHPRLEALTHDAIVRAAKNLAPGDIRKWSVVVDGREFPVKQLVREAANQLHRQRFHRHSCRSNGTRRCPVSEASRLRRRRAVPGVRRNRDADRS